MGGQSGDIGESSKLKTKCTARYSAEKTHHVLHLQKAGASRISNMILKGHKKVIKSVPNKVVKTGALVK